MKKALTTILIFMALSTTAQTVFKLDSLHQFSWDMGLDDWKHNTRELYEYTNGDEKETHLLRLILNGENWDNFYQINKMYNDLNDITERIQQNWTGSDWQNGDKLDYIYNSDDLLERLSYSIYSNPTWLTFNENIYDYDVLDNLKEDILKNLDFASMMLVNDERRLYDYTIHRKDQDIFQFWVNNAWKNDERRDYIYDPSELLIRIEKRAWENNNMQWSIPYQQTLFVNNTDDLPEEITEQIYASGMWNNTARTLNTFDSGNLTIITLQEWNSGTDEWDNGTRQRRTFDTDGNESELIFENWEPLELDWQGFLRILSYWSPTESLSVSFEDIQLQAHIYPNPTTEYINVKLQQSADTKLNVSLYDITGKLITTTVVLPQNDEFNIALKNNKDGIYLLHINSKNGKQVFKVIKS